MDKNYTYNVVAQGEVLSSWVGDEIGPYDPTVWAAWQQEPERFHVEPPKTTNSKESK